MVSKFMNAMDNFGGRLIEKVVDAAEFLCPPLKKFLSWEFVDDGSLFAIHDEDVDAPSSKYIFGPSQANSPSFKERGHFTRHIAAGAA